MQWNAQKPPLNSSRETPFRDNRSSGHHYENEAHHHNAHDYYDDHQNSYPYEYADEHPNHYQDASQRAKLGFAQWLGAILSLSLIVGLAYWGYKLAVRDAEGVPVIRALAGDIRSLPDDPGGEFATYQGLSVNELTADGSAAATADEITLALPPVVLTDEDQPMSEEAIRALAQNREAEVAQAQAALDENPVQSAENPTTNDHNGAEENGIELEQIADETAETDSVNLASARPRLKPPVPVRQPSSSVDLNGVASDLLAALSSSIEVSVDNIPEGTQLVQFMVFSTEERALAGWDRLTQKFGDLFDDKLRVIEKAQNGSNVFYRLRALGFADLEQANTFCAAISASNEQCVPTLQK